MIDNSSITENFLFVGNVYMPVTSSPCIIPTVSRVIFEGCIIISRISWNENFREDCTHKVATLGTWVWFSINFAKINSTNRSNFEIHEIHVHIHPSKITPIQSTGTNLSKKAILSVIFYWASLIIDIRWAMIIQ